MESSEGKLKREQKKQVKATQNYLRIYLSFDFT